mmetsp:Transcript_15744/g.61496  ORF Transcript_15744/g.61496 Transcript_15744/m.61496 type:complete len:234 (+) Transcript_15744:2041-2742(+)
MASTLPSLMPEISLRRSGESSMVSNTSSKSSTILLALAGPMPGKNLVRYLIMSTCVSGLTAISFSALNCLPCSVFASQVPPRISTCSPLVGSGMMPVTISCLGIDLEAASPTIHSTSPVSLSFPAPTPASFTLSTDQPVFSLWKITLLTMPFITTTGFSSFSLAPPFLYEPCVALGRELAPIALLREPLACPFVGGARLSPPSSTTTVLPGGGGSSKRCESSASSVAKRFTLE